MERVNVKLQAEYHYPNHLAFAMRYLASDFRHVTGSESLDLDIPTIPVLDTGYWSLEAQQEAMAAADYCDRVFVIAPNYHKSWDLYKKMLYLVASEMAARMLRIEEI